MKTGKLIFIRRLSQCLFLLLFIYILWSTTYPLKGLLPPKTFFLFDPLVIFITSIARRTMLHGIFFCAGMIALTLVLGRFFCGWVCPLGTTIDIAGALRKKTRLLGSRMNSKLRLPKFLILAVILLCAAAGIQIAWVFDPLVIMARFVSLNLIPTLTLALDKLFIAMISAFGLYGWAYDIYRSLKTSVLGVQVIYFSHSALIFLFFLLVVSLALCLKRAWCRALCPLGAIYALAGRFALLKRVVRPCTACQRCRQTCRMGAINDDLTYVKGECILCMDCVYECPSKSTSFKFTLSRHASAVAPGRSGVKGTGITRKSFLFWLGIGLFSTLGFKNKDDKKQGIVDRPDIIRPPGVSDEGKFLDRCIRCGNCMKVCITNGLQPLLFQQGLEGIWTPQLVPEIGYCEYQCTLCGDTCPTAAIPRLTLDEKKSFKLGLAHIDHSICLPWAKGEDCIVCEEHCPVAQKAIHLREENVNGRVVKRPYVDPYLCVGCGICQNKCPARPVRAVRVRPLGGF
ncbi:MAG: 4Fe-4S binding protein [Candidatus Omnitrophota bacterium]